MSRNSWWGPLNSVDNLHITPKVITRGTMPIQTQSKANATQKLSTTANDTNLKNTSKPGQKLSESVSNEAATNIPQVVSNEASVESVSNAIPIPNQNGVHSRDYDEMKNKSISSFRSWWSSSSSTGRSPVNTPSGSQKDSTRSLPHTPITEEKFKVTTISRSNIQAHQNQNINNNDKHRGNNSKTDHTFSLNTLSPIKETNGKNKQIHQFIDLARSNSRDKATEKLSSSSNSNFDTDYVERHTMFIVRKASDLRLSSSQSSMSSTTSSNRNSWWFFGGYSNNNDSSNDITTKSVDQNIISSDTINVKVDSDIMDKKVISGFSQAIEIPTNFIASEQTYKSSVDDMKTSKSSAGDLKIPKSNADDLKKSKINHIPSPIADGGKSIPSGSKRVVIKKSSSEMRRWSLFNTWSSSTNLLEDTGKGENSKTADMNLAIQTNVHLPSSSSSSSSSSPSSSLKSSQSSPSSNKKSTLKDSNSSPPTSQGATKSNTTSSSTTNSSNTKMVVKDSKNSKLPSNPIVQNISDNNSSWKQFFSKTPDSAAVRIEQSNSKKLITDDKHYSQKETTELTIVNGNKSPPIISSSNNVNKKLISQPVLEPLPKSMPKPVNIVLPSFNEFSGYKPWKCPSSPIQQALHAVNSYLFPPNKQYDSALHKWLDEITRSTVDVKRIAIIGVHGWFPARYIRAIVGEPTGTSPKFCDMMSKAVLDYLSQYNISLPSDAITCIPLEGEGTIETREALLHKNLLNNKAWCEALALADVIFIATHSQGTPVSTILLSKLIKEHLVNPRKQRICMLAMAGISHGPFPSYKENYMVRLLVGSARSSEADASKELFEFMDSESSVSKKYRESLNFVIQSGVKIVYVASMDDQMVPLYSGIFVGVNHPSIMRAIYIDGPLYQENDFLINLIVFAIKLRNAGILDHGLLIQLSDVIAGSMVHGAGHSTLHAEIEVYKLAVKYLFETSPSPGVVEAKVEKFQAQQKNNPYFLPWAMRGILEDKNVLKNSALVCEINKLKKQYGEWDPSTKIMKDVKFRLEPLRDANSMRARL